MNYNIHITDEADHDMNQAVDYIEFSLQNPVDFTGSFARP